MRSPQLINFESPAPQDPASKEILDHGSPAQAGTSCIGSSEQHTVDPSVSNGEVSEGAGDAGKLCIEENGEKTSVKENHFLLEANKVETLEDPEKVAEDQFVDCESDDMKVQDDASVESAAGETNVIPEEKVECGEEESKPSEIPVCSQDLDEHSIQLHSQHIQANDVTSKPAATCAHGHIGQSDPVDSRGIRSEVADSNPVVTESVNHESVGSSPLKLETAIRDCIRDCPETAHLPDKMKNGSSPTSKNPNCVDDSLNVDETGAKKQMEQMSLGPKDQETVTATKKTCSPS